MPGKETVPSLKNNIEKKLNDAFSSIRPKESIEFLKQELSKTFEKLIDKKATLADFEKKLAQYDAFFEDATAKQLFINKILEITTGDSPEKPENTATEPVLKPKIETSTRTKTPSILEQYNITEGTVFYDHKNRQVLIKKVNRETNTLDLEIDGGVQETGWRFEPDIEHREENNIDEPDYFVLHHGKKRIGVSLQSPVRTNLSQLDLSVSKNKKIALETGDTFFDAADTQWKITKILNHEKSTVIQVQNEQGQSNYLHIQKGELIKNQEILRILENRISLKRTTKEEPLTDAQIYKDIEEIKLEQVQFMSGEQGFTLNKGESYLDDDKKPWTVQEIIRWPGTKERYTITIQDESGKIEELATSSWDAYTESLLITTEKDTEHLFTPITSETAETNLTNPDTVEQEETAQQTETTSQETPEEIKQKLQEKLTQYEAVINRLNRVLK